MENKPEDKIRADGTKFSMRNFIKLINVARPKYTLLIVGILMLIASASIQLYVPKLAQSLIDTFSKHMNYSLLIKVVIMFIASALVSALGGAILGVFGEDVIQNLREILWKKLITLEVKYFDLVKVGEISSRLVNDTSQVKQLLANTFPQTLSSVILLLGSIYMMFRMDWHMTLAMVITIPIIILIILPILTVGSKLGHMRQDALAEFNGIASETLAEIRLVKTSNAEKQAKKRGNFEINKLFKIGRKEAAFDATMMPIMMMFMMIMIFGLLAYGMHRVATGEMRIGTLMSFLMYLFNLMSSVPVIGMLFTEIAKVAGSTKRVQDLLDEEVEDLQGGENVELAGKTLEVEHIDFAYKEDEPILKDVSFKAKPNEIIAFAGPSGSGKSTIFSLLERFYEPTAGAIKFDGINVKDINMTNYRSQIGFVSQDSAIMAGTIRENLTYGLDSEYTDEQLWHVLELAFAKNFVSEMPDKLNTEVGERGVKISGGQRQRIAIARAFLRNPKILMLDEATASLDSESEMMVQKALVNLMKDRTTLVIAHRLATIVDSDKIYFLEKGKITGSGAHKELVESHATYAKYVSEQFRVESPAATA